MLQIHRNGSRIFALPGRFLHFFSTSTTTKSADEESPKSVIVDYLVKSLGFTNQQAISASLKVRSVKSRQNPNSVVDFFKQNGFDDAHIKKLVSKRPRVLSCDVEKTLKPKITVLQELGLSGFDLGDFVAACGCRVFESLSKNVVDSLTPIVGTNENVVRVLKRAHRSITAENATRNVTFLQNFGVSRERIQKFAVKYPELLRYSPEKVEEICARVKDEMGFPPESPAFLTIIKLLGSLTNENLELKYQVLRSYGWSKSDITTLLRSNALILMSSEVMLRRKLDFFMEQLGLEAGYIASHPVILNYSFEKRVVPRNAVLQVLKGRKLIRASLDLYPTLMIRESDFLNKFVIPHKDKVPGLYESYSNNKIDSFSKSC